MASNELPARQCDRFESAYRQWAAAAVREPAAPAVRQGTRERLVRCLWFDQDFEDVLRTESGEKLTVLSPGWWNLESGPDFKHASMRFAGGKPLKGDVETHVYASGWTSHGHHRDEAYNNVILHVVMWNDTGKETSPAQDGRAIPVLELDRYVGRPMDELTEVLHTEDYPHASAGSPGRCQELISRAKLDPEWIGCFLDHAGDERMLRKADRFSEMPEAAGPENILYVSLMEAAGYKKNKKPMGRLARLVPLETATALLAEQGLPSLQAALFGMAGLLPAQLELPEAGPDPETSAYLAALRDRWQAVAGRLEGSPLPPRSWSFSGTRPVNHPARRIAGISRLLERAFGSGGLVSAIEKELRRAPAAPSRRVAAGGAARNVISMLSGVTDDYWSRRTGFGGKKLRSETRLIGADRASVMFVDAVVPVMLAAARSQEDRDLENRLHRAYATLPPLEPNSVLRFMASRIFGGEEPAGRIVTSARRQQGLLQLFRDYCEADSEGCRRCAFANALDGG